MGLPKIEVTEEGLVCAGCERELIPHVDEAHRCPSCDLVLCAGCNASVFKTQEDARKYRRVARWN